LTGGRGAAFIVFLAAFALFAVGAASRGLWEADEHRIAEVAREMVASGDWIVPHLEGAPYVHKPPLVQWIIAVCHGPLGMDLALAAKVPSMFGAALAVTATFLIARRLYGTAAAVASATALASAAEFVWISRRAQYDPLVAGFTTFSLWFFVRSRFPAEGETPRPWSDAILGGLCVGLAGLAKGHVALAFTVPVFLAFAVLAGEWRGLLSLRAAAAVVCALLPAALWLGAAGARAGGEFVGDVLGHGAEHASGDVDKADHPFWYYLRSFPESLAPWTLFVPAAVAAATVWRRAHERRADLFVLAACVAPFVVMSAIPARRGLYLVPLVPAACVLVAKLAAVDEDRLRSRLFAVPRHFVGAIALVGGSAAAAVALMAAFGLDAGLEDVFGWWAEARKTLGTPLLALAAALGSMIALSGMRALRTASAQDAFGRLLGAGVAGTILVAGVACPAVDPLKSPRDFYEQVAEIAGSWPIVRYGVDDYAGHWILERDRIPFVAEAAGAERFLAREKGPAFVVVERSVMEERGRPAGVLTVLDEPCSFEDELLLLARGAPR
jgi:4-amino-4-deoxy-L-arabinose transferase-like glycosyltransferase